MPSRRTVLRATTLGVILGVTGCLGDGSDAADGSQSPTDTPTDNPSPTDSEGTPTETPMDLPEDCQSPAFDDAPSLPDVRTNESMATFAREFERAYQDHALPDGERLADLDVDVVREVGDGFAIELGGEAEAVTLETGTSTATEQPQDAMEWKATYRVRDATVERTLVGIAGGRELDTDCWTLGAGERDALEMPADCSSPPAIDELPSLPAERTEASMSAFATEFERAYKAHTAPEHRQLDHVEVTEVTDAGGGYLLRAQVDMAAASTGTDDATPSPMPTDTGLFVVTYRITDQRVHREEKAFTGGTTAEDCWTVAVSDEGTTDG